MAKKKTKTKKQKKGSDGKPQIIAAKGGKSQSEILSEILAGMDEENWISKRVARDFVETLRTVVEDELSNGRPVQLFGIVKVTPRLHTAGVREVHSEFGNPESEMVEKKYKAKVSYGISKSSKILKDALPSVQKMQRAVGK